MNYSLILGNIFSFCAIFCLATSALKKSKKSLIGWQILDTSFFTISVFILQSYSAVTTNIINLTRNIIAYYNKLSFFLTFLLCFLIIFVGFYFNNRGIIGWLPIIASVVYTICFYISKNEQHMRWGMAFNQALWCVHDAYIRAYPAAIYAAILVVWTIIQITKNKKMRISTV